MASDPELAADHLRAQALLAKFNATAAYADAERHMLLTQLLGRIGEGTVIKPVLRCDYGYNITIGDRTFVTMTVSSSIAIASELATKCKLLPASTSTRRHIPLKLRYDARAWSTLCPSRSKTASGLGAAASLVPALLSGPIRWWAPAAWSREICRPTWWQSAVPVASSGSCEGKLRGEWPLR